MRRHPQPEDVPIPEEGLPPAENSHRNKFRVTCDRLMALSPRDVERLARTLLQTPDGEHIARLLVRHLAVPKESAVDAKPWSPTEAKS